MPKEDKEEKVNFIGWMVILAFVLNITFTTVVIYIFFYTGQEPHTLIAAWFAFTTGEIVVGGALQRKKYDIEYGRKEPFRPPPGIVKDAGVGVKSDEDDIL